MSNPTSVRRLLPDDRLYRKINRDDWDRETSEIADEAFVDTYAAQSFFLARVKSPSEVLRFFARFGEIRKACGKSRPKPIDLYEYGLRVAELRVSEIRAQGFSFAVDVDGNEYREDGHVNVLGLREKPHLISGKARLLTRRETLRESD